MPYFTSRLSSWVRHCVAMPWLLSSGVAMACSCMQGITGQFLHAAPGASGKPAVVTVPANARGILFFPNEYPDFLVRDQDGHVLVGPPVALSAKQFRIIERGTGRKLTPVAVRLRVEKQMGVQPYIYYLASPEMQQCAEEKNASMPMCRRVKAMERNWDKAEPEGPSDEVKRFAVQQGLREVSEEIDASYGLYRIEAREGFKPGKLYDISYRSTEHLLRAVLRMGTTPLRINAPGQFSVRTDGAPRRENLQMAQGGTCHRTTKLASQPLQLAWPPAYNAYSSLVMYYMRHTLHQEDRQQAAPPGRFFSFQYWPSLCTEIAHGSSFHGNGRELAVGDCKAPAAREVKAYAGILEVEDRLHETAPLSVTFPKAKPDECPAMMDEVYPIYVVPAKAA